MNYIKASLEVFEEYGVAITLERQLADGEYIRHFETTDPVYVLTHLDERVTMWTEEALQTYIEWTEGGE